MSINCLISPDFYKTYLLEKQKAVVMAPLCHNDQKDLLHGELSQTIGKSLLKEEGLCQVHLRHNVHFTVSSVGLQVLSMK